MARSRPDPPWAAKRGDVSPTSVDAGGYVIAYDSFDT